MADTSTMVASVTEMRGEREKRGEGVDKWGERSEFSRKTKLQQKTENTEENSDQRLLLLKLELSTDDNWAKDIWP